MKLFKSIKPYQHAYLDVGDGHKMYYEMCGNPKGKPVLYVHGGPGAGCSGDSRRFFNPKKFNIPLWLLNRRKDPETNEDKHLITDDIRFVQENDVKILKKIKSYKGVRHMHGLPTRGQRTKSNFRRNKGNVIGVKRKKGKSGRT